MTSILVVDDSAVDRSLVGGLLRKTPEFSVDYAVNGAEALQKLEQYQPDLVISDLIMPELDGLQLVAAVRSRYPLVPVILMTSKGSEEIAVQALQAGAASYVPKRKLSMQLVYTVDNVLSASAAQRGHSRLMGCMMRSHFTFVLGNDYTLFHPLITYLQENAGHLGLGDPVERTRLGVALEEALANALYHGNLEVASSLREVDDRAYFDTVEARRCQEPYQSRRIHVEAVLSRDEAEFVVRDDGQGFDPTQLPDPTDPANLEKSSGRGILLMRTFMDQVTFNPQGNEVRMLKRRK